MALTPLTQSQLVAIQVAAQQAENAGLQDFSEGAVLLALAQSNGEVGLWLQAILLQLALLTRASTSQGPDLDSWMADFDFSRLQAVAATGPVTFARASTGSQVVVPVGSTVETLDGTQSFTVIADSTNGAYSSGLGGYVMGSGAASASATVRAVTPGSGGNVAGGTISVISGAIPGVDTVSNPNAFTSGSDAEKDPAYRARFVSDLDSLAEGTPEAVRTAIEAVQQGLDIELIENQSPAGGQQSGFFYVVADDGTGSPSAGLLGEIRAAADAVRGLGIEFAVLGPQLIEITITLTIVGGDPTAVQNAIENYVNGAGLGGAVELTKLIQLAYNASADVSNVTNVLLNGGTADIACDDQQRPIVSAVTVAT